MDSPPSGGTSPALPPHQGLGTALVAAGMVAVVYAAAVVAVFGVISVITDTDVVSEPDAPVLIAPAMVAVAGIVVFLSVLTGLRPGRAGGRVPVARAIVTALAAYLLAAAAGAIGWAFSNAGAPVGTDPGVSALLFFARQLGGPYLIGACLLALLPPLLLPLIRLGRSRPR